MDVCGAEENMSRRPQGRVRSSIGTRAWSGWACRRKEDRRHHKNLHALGSPTSLSFNVARSTHNASLRHTRLQVVGRGARDAYTDADVVLFAVRCDDIDEIVGTRVLVVEPVRKAVPLVQAVGGVGIHVVAPVPVRYGLVVLQLPEVDDEVFILARIGCFNVRPHGGALGILLNLRGNLDGLLRDVVDGRLALGFLERRDARHGGQSDDDARMNEEKELLLGMDGPHRSSSNEQDAG